MNENNRRNYLTLNNLQIYRLARKLSTFAWEVYETLDWRIKKLIGDQFVRSIDSIGANIAEGYGRFHYLDKIKFYYNARASHCEGILHWLELLRERQLIGHECYEKILIVANELAPKLNSFINPTYEAKSGVQIADY